MGVRWLVTDRRLGGDDFGSRYAGNLATHVGDDPAAVARRRAVLAAELGLAPESLVWMDQVHGRDVAVVDGPQGVAVPAVDALVTATPGLALSVLAADCRPVLLTGHRRAARAAGTAGATGTAGVTAAAGVTGAAGGPPCVIGALHAGRRGLQLGVVPAAVQRLRDLGATDVRAHVGPGVCAACYPVPERMRADVVATVPAAHAVSADGQPALDLLAGISAQLRAAGVDDIAVDTRCTAGDPGLPSYRRDGRTGRLAGVIVLA